MAFRIDAENLAGKTGTVETQNLSYVDPLNQIREGVLKFESLNSTDQELLQEGSKLLIYKNAVQQLYAEVTTIERFDGGAVKVTFAGKEITMARENGDYTSSPWVSTASATIFTSIINESSEWSPGTIASGVNIDFRLEKSDSILNACGDLIGKTGQDIIFNDSNTASLKVDISNHRGSTTSVETLNDGLEISNISYRRTYPQGNFVIVYGSSEGETEIKSQTSSGQDAPSQATYGVIVKTVIDPTASTVDEANAKADILVEKYKDPIKVYMFNVNDLSSEVVTGDVITINSADVGLEDEEVRVTAVERGIKNNKEFLSFEVVNKEFSETLIKTGQEQMKLDKRTRDNSAYNQFANEYSNQNVATNIGGLFTIFGTNLLQYTGADDSGFISNVGSYSTSNDHIDIQTFTSNKRITLTTQGASGHITLTAGGNVEIESTLDLRENDIDNVDDLSVNDIFKNGAGDIDVFDNMDFNGNDLLGVFEIFANTNFIDLYGDVHIVDDGTHGSGNFDVDGTKNCVVYTEEFGALRLSAIESPEIWFEEKLSVSGKDIEVNLDPKFIATTTINEEYPLNVHVTPTSECDNFWIEKFYDKIIIHNTLNGSFDLTISARRKGYETVRFDRLESVENREEEKQNIQTAKQLKISNKKIIKNARKSASFEDLKSKQISKLQEQLEKIKNHNPKNKTDEDCRNKRIGELENSIKETQEYSFKKD